MAAQKQTKKTPPTKKRSEVSSARQIQAPEYRSFRPSKRISHPGPKLPSSLKLFKESIKKLQEHKKLFYGIVLVYLVLTVALVKGFSLTNDLPEIKATFEEIFAGGTGKFISTLAIFSFLVGSAGSANSDIAGTYQSILLIVVSLALIWALRQAHAKNKVTVKDSFYKGLCSLIPFLLVMVLISIQLLPLLAGAGLYSLVTVNGLAVNMAEKAVWLLLFGLLALLSLYMITSSVFALYIVTLPEVTPLQALRSAKGLVHLRRWTVMRKVLFLPVLLITTAAIIMIPLIMFVTPVAEWVFFVLSMLSLAVIHSYMYTLYRKLL